MNISDTFIRRECLVQLRAVVCNATTVIDWALFYSLFVNVLTEPAKIVVFPPLFSYCAISSVIAIIMAQMPVFFFDIDNCVSGGILLTYE
jgi:hypothetical protein